jgi:hypothetical protein
MKDQNAAFPSASPADEIVCTLDEIGDALAPAAIELFLGETGALPPPAEAASTTWADFNGFFWKVRGLAAFGPGPRELLSG